MATTRLKYTLIADGSSDRVLIQVIDWLILQHCQARIESQFASHIHIGPLSTRIKKALDIFPCDILFIHRDAEKSSITDRLEEINTSMTGNCNLYIPIIPIRMTEAWLLSSETAIRLSTGNPHGKEDLGLSHIKNLEANPDPKEILLKAIENASEKKGRRLKKFNAHECRHRVAELTDDFSPLRALSAFNYFENSLIATLTSMNILK